MDLSYEAKIDKNTAIFIYNDYKIEFIVEERAFVLKIFTSEHNVLLYTREYYSDGNLFFQQETLFNYLSWEIFSKMREITVKHCHKSDEHAYIPSDNFLKSDFFVYLDGPNKRMNELDLAVGRCGYSSEWLALEFYDGETAHTARKTLDKIWRDKENIADTGDEELNKEYQYILDNIFVSF
jgi:hypothetical protein